MAKQLPKEADLISYDYAVAGHDGVLSDVDGELFIKPCTAAEAAFYEASTVNHPEFAELMPTFMGTLELSPQQNATIEEQGAALIAQHTIPEVVVPSKPLRGVTKKIATNMAVVLENAAHGFVRPNILDVKLGVRLWADDAALDKKQRFDIITENTTHKNLGFRIAGMRVWLGNDSKPGGDIDQDGYRIYNKDYGRFSVTDENVEDSFRQFIFSESAGVDQELGRLVAQAFVTDLERIQETIEKQESRMFSASLLFVFEGDGRALRVAMEEASRATPALTNGTSVDFDEDEGFEDEVDIGPKVYAVKVIDFAHAQWTPGLGPDENSLLGVRSVAQILKNLSGDISA